MVHQTVLESTLWYIASNTDSMVVSLTKNRNKNFCGLCRYKFLTKFLFHYSYQQPLIAASQLWILTKTIIKTTSMKSSIKITRIPKINDQTKGGKGLDC